MKKRQVYLRQGILHVCLKGGLYAPDADPAYVSDELLGRRAGSALSGIKHKDKVTVTPCPNEEGAVKTVMVEGDVHTEIWSLYHIPTAKEQKELKDAAETLAVALDANLTRVYRMGDPQQDLDTGMNILDVDDDEGDDETAVCPDCGCDLVDWNDTVASLNFDDDGNEIEIALCGPCGRERDRACGVI